MKTTSIRLDEHDERKINEIKKYYSECWGIDINQISTTDVIRWSIGITHLVKVQYDISLAHLPDKDNIKTDGKEENRTNGFFIDPDTWD